MGRKSFYPLNLLMVIMAMCSGCIAMQPEKYDFDMPAREPLVKVTTYSKALQQLGRLSEVHCSEYVRVQCTEISDLTGTSAYTSAEIPKSVTEMANSAINTIGGKVSWVPYIPVYLQHQQIVGYPVSQDKLPPDVLLIGGITEFDRGLELFEKTRNFGTETGEFSNTSKWFPNNTVGLDYGNGDKWSRAQITIDFNLIDYKSVCGISGMQTTNTVSVYKKVAEEEAGFTLFGPTVGIRGLVKSVQGRHDALRLLIQLGVIQIVGRFMKLPYWTLIEGIEPDPEVVNAVTDEYKKQKKVIRSLMIQKMLILNGYDVPVTGEIDAKTKLALHKFDDRYNGIDDTIEAKVYFRLYESVPPTDASVANLKIYTKRYEAYRREIREGERKPDLSDWSEEIGDAETAEILKDYQSLPLEETIDRIIQSLGRKEKPLKKQEEIKETTPEIETEDNKKPVGW